jgi:hypothetical protein
MAISKRKRVHAFWLMAALPLCAKAAAPVEQAVSTSVAPHSAASEATLPLRWGPGWWSARCMKAPRVTRFPFTGGESRDADGELGHVYGSIS